MNARDVLDAPTTPTYDAKFNVNDFNSAAAFRGRAAGYNVGGISRTSNDLDGDGVDDQATPRNRAASQNLMNQILEIGGKSFTFSDVKNFVSREIKDDEIMSNINEKFAQPLTEKDFMLDERGNQIKTIEEKHAYEAKYGQCSALVTAEETRMGPDGKLYRKDAFDKKEEYSQRIDENKGILGKLDKGEMSVHDIPDQMKDRLAERHGKPEAEISAAPETSQTYGIMPPRLAMPAPAAPAPM